MFVVKVPGVNSNGETVGCEKLGNSILESLKEIHSNEQGKIVDTNLLDLEEIHINNSNNEFSNSLIYKNSSEIFEEKQKTIFLGGDHSITFSLTRGFLDVCKKQGKEPCLIIFDSHPGCEKPSNRKIPNNREWLYSLIDIGFPPENVLLVGTRNSQIQEIEFLSKNRIRT